MKCLFCYGLALATAIGTTAMILAEESHISREAIEWCNIVHFNAQGIAAQAEQATQWILEGLQ